VEHPYVWMAVGVALTWVGAELLVRGAARLALGLGVRPLVVGLTVVALGTSSPEAVVSGLAAWHGKGSVALGNVVGSNIANIGLILGILALISPVPTRWRQLRADVYLLLAASVLAGLLAFVVGSGSYSRAEGIVLLVMLAAYVGYYIKTGHEPPPGEIDLQDPELPKRSAWASGALAAAGLVVLLFGAQRFLDSATEIALRFGLSDAVVGGTILAVGTSLPELAASLVAVARGHHDLGVGNILGSNVMNLVFVLGGVATISPSPVPVDGQAATIFFPVMFVFLAALVLFLRVGSSVSRWEGGVLLLGYVAFAIRVYL